MLHEHNSLTLLGQNVRNRRSELGLTQERLADLAELDPTYISGIERGVRNPSVLSLLKVAEALETTIAKLCTGIQA